jgi:hypothetical protein
MYQTGYLIGRPSPLAIACRPSDLRIASFSDVHLGHPTTPTRLILDNLYKAFPDNAKTGELDLILLGGDLFDSELHYGDVFIQDIEKWMYYMLCLCFRRKIVLRVLEGTFSHDRAQGANFEKIHEIAKLNGIEADFRYVKNIEVERIEALGISMLYVPDFTTAEVDRIWKEVQDVLAKAGLEKVDYANIHGAFSYQLPEISGVQAACHSMERYLSVVHNYIFTGHIHLSSVYDRILCNGSFDRLAHGEEEPKGHWEALIRRNGEDDFTFVENSGAKLYKSLDVTGLSLEEGLKTIEAFAGSLPKGSAIRLVAEKGDPILHSIARLRKEWPDLQWTSKSVEVKDVQKNLLVDQRANFTEIQITRDNVSDLLMARVKRRTDNPVIHNRCNDYLREYVS